MKKIIIIALLGLISSITNAQTQNNITDADALARRQAYLKSAEYQQSLNPVVLNPDIKQNSTKENVSKNMDGNGSQITTVRSKAIQQENAGAKQLEVLNAAKAQQEKSEKDLQDKIKGANASGGNPSRR